MVRDHPVRRLTPFRAFLFVTEHRNDVKDLVMDQHVFTVALPAEQEGVFLLWPEQVDKRELVVLVSISSAKE